MTVTQIDGKITVQESATNDSGLKLLEQVAALNSMIGWQSGSVFIAGPLAECDDFFLVDRFTTDGDRLCAVAQHDGTCRDIVGGWVYDLKHRRYVYGEGGPLEHDLR